LEGYLIILAVAAKYKDILRKTNTLLVFLISLYIEKPYLIPRPWRMFLGTDAPEFMVSLFEKQVDK
jgi:hypothetical protein